MGIGVNEISNPREFLYSLFRASSYGIVRPSEIPQRKAIREELTMMILEGKVRRIVMQVQTPLNINIRICFTRM